MNMIELKSSMWSTLPTEISHRIAEFTGCFKLRNGVLTRQISKDDLRFQILTTIPKIVISCYYRNREYEMFMSKVVSTRTLGTNPLTGAPLNFEIHSNTRSPIKGLQINHLLEGDDTVYTYNMCRSVVFKFGQVESTTVCMRKFAQIVVNCDGNVDIMNEL